MADRLGNGTSVVAATGVIFDLWVSFYLIDKPDTKVTRIITFTIVIFLLFGLYLMATGFLQKERGDSPDA